jgi:Cys-tRNA(Pro)/Cys-tRNA(Cys) deacylase
MTEPISTPCSTRNPGRRGGSRERRGQVDTQTPATDVLTAGGVPHHVRWYDHNPHATAHGADAAAALDLDAARIFKTLIVRAGAALVVAVLPVSAELDLKSLARVAGTKRAELADPATAQRSSGYVVRGISPLGQKRSLPTIVDDSAQDWDTIYVSGGRRGLEIEIAPADLVAVTNGRLAPIARLARRERAPRAR